MKKFVLLASFKFQISEAFAIIFFHGNETRIAIKTKMFILSGFIQLLRVRETTRRVQTHSRHIICTLNYFNSRLYNCLLLDSTERVRRRKKRLKRESRNTESGYHPPELSLSFFSDDFKFEPLSLPASDTFSLLAELDSRYKTLGNYLTHVTLSNFCWNVFLSAK